jgi:hypothetical protein
LFEGKYKKGRKSPDLYGGIATMKREYRSDSAKYVGKALICMVGLRHQAASPTLVLRINC